MSGGAQTSGLEIMWDLRLAEVAGNLVRHGFRVDVLPDLPAAAKFFTDTLLPEYRPASVAVCGSQTVVASGLYETLAARPGLEFINPYTPGRSAEENLAARYKGLLADIMLTSSNALLRDGRLLNLDGLGNRVAAMHFGPKRVVLFIGRNKICEDLTSAGQRVRQIASPANSIRLSKNTPCVKTGKCLDCSGPDRICNVWTFTERCFPQGRIHVLLINVDLGF
jgi:hypothetical protein